MVQETILKVENLHKSYGKLEALKGVDFVIPKGKIAGLVGPNGAGKTTLIKCLTNLHKFEGRISIMGSRQDEINKFKIGFMGESRNYYDRLTGKEYLKYFANLYSIKNPDKKINDKLEMVGLFERKDDLIRGYSNGMKQRLGIARTLLHDPKLLIYDEPLSGLDPIIKHKINKIIQDISEKNECSVLISSHQLKDIEEMCDWVVLIKKGEIIDHGEPSEVSNRTETVREIALTIDEDNITKALKVKDEVGIVIDVENNDSTFIIQISNKKGADTKVLKWFMENDIEFSLKHGSLDSMYRSVFE